MKVTSNKWIAYSLVIVSSVALFIIASSLAALGFEYKIIIGSALYFLLTYFSLKYQAHFNPGILFTLIIFPILLVILVFNIFQYKSAAISAPSNLLLLMSACSGFLFYKKRNYLLPITLVLLLAGWHYKGNRMFLNYLSYGTLSGQANERIPLTNMFTTEGTPVRPNLSKTVILDFWNSKCGYCYAQFPFVDSIHKKIDTSRFDLSVVNIPFKHEKKEDNFGLLNRFNYGFKQLFAENSSSMDSFGITAFPTTLVLRQNKIIFRGNFKEALKLLDIQ